jgi:hypothetical protein
MSRMMEVNGSRSTNTKKSAKRPEPDSTPATPIYLAGGNGPAPRWVASDVPDDLDVEEMRTRVRMHVVQINKGTEQVNLHRAGIGEILWVVSNSPGALKRLGHDTVGEWMKQEFGLNRRMAEQLRRNHEVFLVEHTLSPEFQERVRRCDFTKLREIAPHVTDSNAEAMVKLAETLSRRELVDRLRLLETHTPTKTEANDSSVLGSAPCPKPEEENGPSKSVLAATKSLQVNDAASVKKFVSKIESKLPVLLIAVDRATGKIVYGASLTRSALAMPTSEATVTLLLPVSIAWKCL